MLELETGLSLKAKLFRGLADPSRLSILETLRQGPKCVSEIVAETGLSQPNVSGHLNCLRGCGLVKAEQRGRHVYYAISFSQVAELLRLAGAVLSQVAEEIYRCSAYPGEEKNGRRS